MVHAIREFFEKHIQGPRQAASAKYDPLQMASAALLVEMMRMDGEVTEGERLRVTEVLETSFGLPRENIVELLDLAEEQAREATDYYQFTSLIKSHLSAEEKERLIEQLWSVAYADGELNRFEEHLLRKLADLLHVSHKSFIAAKLREHKRR